MKRYGHPAKSFPEPWPTEIVTDNKMVVTVLSYYVLG
jgi:hypothetical protein